MRKENKTSCDPRDFLIDLLFSVVRNRDQVVAYERKERSTDNSLQFGKIMKISKAASVTPSEKKLHGIPYFMKQGYFEEDTIEIQSKNNCPIINIPTCTVTYCSIVTTFDRVRMT